MTVLADQKCETEGIREAAVSLSANDTVLLLCLSWEHALASKGYPCHCINK